MDNKTSSGSGGKVDPSWATTKQQFSLTIQTISDRFVATLDPNHALAQDPDVQALRQLDRLHHGNLTVSL